MAPQRSLGALERNVLNAARVLIVDDDLATLDLTRFVLCRADFVVESTSDPTHALLLIRAFQPDLILMDIQMPEVMALNWPRC